MKRQVLIIEDDDGLRMSLAQTIELAGMIPMPMSGYVQARRHIRANFSGVILSDIRMPHQDGFDVLRAARNADTDLPLILMTGHSDVPTAMRAIKEGAWEYLEKPCSTDRLIEVLERAMAHREVVLRSRRIERDLDRNDPARAAFPGSGGASTTLRHQLKSASEHRRHVHIFGETGTGRIMAARLINSLAVDPVPLLIAGADIGREELMRQLQGLEGEADFLLDFTKEDVELDPDETWRLLVEQPGLRPVTVAGESLAGLRLSGLLSVFESSTKPDEIRVPTLDERREDLPEIFEVLLRQAEGGSPEDAGEITEDLLAEIMSRPWQGNLPELQAFVRSAAHGGQSAAGAAGRTLAEQLDAFEKRVIEETLRKTGGKAAEAARLLGLPRNTFYDRLARYDLSPKSFRPSGDG